MNQVSVIIPTYNRKKFLKKAIDSVLTQSFADFELIVVDDGSDDKTKELINTYADDRLVYFYQDNQGVSCARNLGLKQAKGEYIAFLDSDDWWEKDKLKIQVEFLKKNRDIVATHTEEVWYRADKLLNPKLKHRKQSGYIFEQCLQLCAVSISTAVLRRELFDKVGYFDEELEVCEDYDFWLRVSCQYPIILIPQYLTLKDGGRQDQLSFRYRPGIDRFRIRAIEKLLDSRILNDEQFALAVKELKAKCKIFIQGATKRGKDKIARFYRQLSEKWQ